MGNKYLTKITKYQKHITVPQWYMLVDNKVQILYISPSTKTMAAHVSHATSLFACQTGSYTNETLVSFSPALLESKYNKYPADSYQPYSKIEATCLACSLGSVVLLNDMALISVW